MPVRLDGDHARLEGVCGAEDAADLADWLRDGGGRVSVTGEGHMHTAVLQCLVAFEVALEGPLPFPYNTAGGLCTDRTAAENAETRS